MTELHSPEPTREATAALGTTAARAVLWNYVSFASGKVLVLVTMAVLARLLTPADFGIVGFATLVIAYLAVLKDLGLGAALIQRDDDIEEAAQTVYTLNLMLGALLTAATSWPRRWWRTSSASPWSPRCCGCSRSRSSSRRSDRSSSSCSRATSPSVAS